MSADKILLLVTDLDDTLVGDDDAKDKLNQWLTDIREKVHLVYSTGRSYTGHSLDPTDNSARRLQAEKSLLEPDYWVTSVGTEIYTKNSPDRDPIWDLKLQSLSEGWDREAVVSIIAKSFPLLEPQPKADQGPWKVSFYLEDLASASALGKLRELLTANGLPAQVIFSSRSSHNVDIVPEAGNKGKATEYIREKLQMGLEQTVVCGDSGNDISLFEHQEHGVIVGKARQELLDWYEANKMKKPHLYKANAHCARGIIEGLDHFIGTGMMPQLKQSWEKHFKSQAISEA
jgi:sucrose-6-phosphatase